MTPAQAEFETAVRQIGERLYRDAGRHKPALFDSRGLRGRVLERVLHDPALRNALFQFIDVLPQPSIRMPISTTRSCRSCIPRSAIRGRNARHARA